MEGDNRSVSECSSTSGSISPYMSDSSEENEVLESAGCYMNEPEYTQEELKKMELDSTNLGNSASGSDFSDSDEGDSSRLENLHWCKCKKCVIFENFKIIECKCCREYSDLLNEKLNDIVCITEHPDFDILCLNKTVLETALIRHRRYNQNFRELASYSNK